MPFFHAVVSIDHHSAQVLQFDTEHVQAQKVKSHSQHTRQHASAARTEHEFFGEVCDALAGITEVLVVGSHPWPATPRRCKGPTPAAASPLPPRVQRQRRQLGPFVALPIACAFFAPQSLAFSPAAT